MTERIRASHTDLQRLRLRAQLLSPRLSAPISGPDARVEQVVRHLGALQGQDWHAVRWALGARVSGASIGDVHAPFDSGQIVRSWPMRGTLHVVAAADIGWMQRLMSAPILAGAAKRREIIGLELAQIEALRAVAEHELAGGKSISRDQLMRAAQNAGVALAGQQRYHAIWYLAQTGTLVFGPVRAGEQHLVLADEWITSPADLEGDEAAGELLWRYLVGHGAATERDFSWWTRLGLRVTRRALAQNADRITELEVEGEQYWAPSELLNADRHATESASRHGSALLLPGFDEYYLGYTARGLVIDDEFAPRIVPGNNGMFKPIVVVDGVVVGTWSRKLTTKRVTVILEPFMALSARARTALERAADDVGSFFGLPAVLEISG